MEKKPRTRKEKIMLKGLIDINRPQGNDCDYINIRIIDKDSHTPFIDVHVGYEEFTLALTGQSERPCEFEVRMLDLVGKKRESEYRQVWIPKIDSYDTGKIEKNAANAIQLLEKDGWVGSVRDTMNPNNQGKQERDGLFAKVCFTRFVDKEVGK